MAKFKTMYDDERKIIQYNDNIAQQSIVVGIDGITKIEVYKEHGSGDFIPYLAIWKGGYLYMRTPGTDKEIIYEK